ncbi:MAG: hypothetical protein NWQ19_08030 [Nonlabens sp.]|nr:hypothetical protein [Nonlabens sp.]
MRQLSLFLILTISVYGYAQSTSGEGTLGKKDSAATFNDPCEDSKQAAIAAAQNGIFIVKHYGIIAQNRPHEQAYRAMMHATYGVQFEDYGCVISSKELCAMTAYKIEIRKAYGLTFLEDSYDNFIAKMNKED